MSVCLWLNNSGTAGPIWLNFFLLTPSWSRGGFRPKKFQVQDMDFRKSGKIDFPAILTYVYTLNIFLQKSLNLLLKMRELQSLDFKDSVTYCLLRWKGRASSKSVEGAQPPPR